MSITTHIPETGLTCGPINIYDIFKAKGATINIPILPSNCNNMWLLTKQEFLEVFNVLKLWKKNKICFKSHNTEIIMVISKWFAGLLFLYLFLSFILSPCISPLKEIR